MSAEREKRIAAYRRQQPVDELRRKYLKSCGRHTHQMWSQEELDLAHVEAKELADYFAEQDIDDGSQALAGMPI